MADVTTPLNSWSITSSANQPTDATSIGSGLDDNLREIQAVVRAALAYYNSTPVASAGTTNIGAAAGNFLDISGTTTITAFDSVTAGIWKVIRFQGALTLTHSAGLYLPGAANITTAANDVAFCYSLGTGNWVVPFYQPTNGRPIIASVLDGSFKILNTSDTSKTLTFSAASISSSTTRTISAPDYDARIGNLPAGIVIDYAGSSTPTGWLLCDGSAVSRTTYSALFSAIGTTWGAGDGSTTFNVPNLLGRVTIGQGTGTAVESCTSSSGNGFVVASNNTKWVTGMPVVLSALTGFTTSATAGPTYYVARISATNIRLATTLALAQALTPNVTISGSGTATVTYTMTARSTGENGGEEAHAMNATELLAHVHTYQTFGVGGGTGATPVVGQLDTPNTGSTGGNSAMNIMQPFAAVRKIISY